MGDRKRILIVDDEPANRDLLEALLTGMGHATELAADGYQALAQLRLGFDLILLDVMMPHLDGFEVARRVRGGTECPDTPICMVTTLSGKEERLRAVEAGANDLIAKPVDQTELKVRTASLLRTKAAQDALQRHQAELEATVARRTEALRQALQEMAEAQRRTHQAQLETIERLALAAELKDADTALHLKRMSHYCHVLARGLKLSPPECELLLHASPMHDVGKIGIPDAILLKPGQLDAAEWQIMRTHTEIGARILGESTSELLQAGEILARTHHEKWDGSGYPRGLSGAAIPRWGRIAAVADVFDALTSRRPYKEPFPTETAFQIMREGRATHFDPGVLAVFFDNLDAVLAIKERYREPAAAEPPTQPP